MDAESGDDNKDDLTTNEEVNHKTGEADERNLEVDSKNEVMHI